MIRTGHVNKSKSERQDTTMLTRPTVLNMIHWLCRCSDARRSTLASSCLVSLYLFVRKENLLPSTHLLDQSTANIVCEEDDGSGVSVVRLHIQVSARQYRIPEEGFRGSPYTVVAAVVVIILDASLQGVDDIGCHSSKVPTVQQASSTLKGVHLFHPSFWKARLEELHP